MIRVLIVLTIIMSLTNECQASGYLKLIFANPESVPLFTKNKSEYNLNFKDDRLSKIFLQYKIIEFKKEYPISDSFPDNMTPAVNLRLVYKVIIDTTAGNNYDELKRKIDLIKSPLLKTTVRARESYSLVAPNDYNYNYYGPDDPSFTQQLDLVNAVGAWNVTKGLSCIKIGITDINFQQHKDFINTDGSSKIVTSTALAPQHCINPVAKYPVSPSTCGSYTYTYARYDCFHGVSVAGMAGAATNNGVGGASLGYNVSVEFYTDNYDGIVNAIYDKCKVVNCSWYDYHSSSLDIPSLDVQDVLNLAALNNVTIVAAAGNGMASGALNASEYYYPASYDGVISVTAVGSQWNVGDATHGANWKDCHREFLLQNDPNWDTSFTYEHNNRVDICAPGYYLQLMADNDAYYLGGGTSYAAPMVSAAAALLYSINPLFTPSQIESYLKTYATNIYGVYDNVRWTGLLGAGRLNAGASLQAAASSAYTGPAYCSSCPIETTFLTNTNHGSPSGYFYNQNIIAGSNNTNVVQTSTSISTSFVATNSITLKPGFQATSTASITFSASIQPCVNPNGGKSAIQNPLALNSKSQLPNELNGLTIYPNPAKSSIKISFFLDKDEKAYVRIFNSYGIMVKDVATTSSGRGDNNTVVNIKDLPQGFYYVSLSSASKKLTGKFIKGNQ